MKRVVATCIYSRDYSDPNHEVIYQCWNFSVNSGGEIVPLVIYEPGETPEPYKYTNLNDLYTSLLNILKQNNFCVSYDKGFNRIWYNIQFIELGSTKISKYGWFKPEEV